MRILLTGGSGLLGKSLRRRFLRTEHELFAPPHAELDVTDARAAEACVAALRPDAVLHCAAYSQVDRAEREEALCRRINVQGTENLARACAARGCYLLYISTDYVFDGEKPAPYETDDPKAPLSAYGRSKADGEDAVLRFEGNCVLRTSWLFGREGRHFPAAILRLGRERGSLRVVDDQVGSPTWAEDLAETILAACEARVPGILHATNEGACSWAEFARAILAGAGCRCAVEPISAEEYGAAARRPKNSRLSKASLDRAGLKRLPTWQEGLNAYLAECENS